MTLVDYLSTRRSSLSITLEEPGPNEAELRKIVEIASRVPDHGKLAPWRFESWPLPVRETMHEDLLALLERRDDLADREKKRAEADKLLHAPCLLAAISTAAPHPKIPEWEQQLSAGAACLAALMAANAHGYEAQWLTAWYVFEAEAVPILGLAAGERIAGLIHIGTSSAPKSERPRPALDDIFSIRES